MLRNTACLRGTQSSHARISARRLVLAILVGSCVLPSSVGSQALGTAFTYQGQLTESGAPATGLYDLQICLFDSPSNPAPIACLPDFDNVPVEDGVFTVALDFGAAVFVGQQRFLELRVRPGASSAGYTILAPRQLVRPAPEALRSNLASAAPWSGLTGVPSGFADGIDDIGGAGTVTSITAGTGLSGGTITGSGTIGIADGGVLLAQIAPNAVDSARVVDGSLSSADLAPGAVGLAQINTTQVQARVTGACVVGEYLRGINADGSVACEPVPGLPRISTVDDPANDVGRFTSLAFGTDGFPVISYFDSSSGALKVAKCANAACAGQATISTVANTLGGTVGLYSAIAIGADGLPVISYFDSGNAVVRVAKCVNPDCSGTATRTTIDNASTASGQWTDIAIGNDGLPVISYRGTTDLRVAKCGNAACTGTATITTVDNNGFTGNYSSITVAEDGRPVISYSGSLGRLNVAKCANPACTGVATITLVDSTPGLEAEYTAIAIGSDGLPVISYVSAAGTDTLNIAKCAAADCTGTATITTMGFAGRGTSIAIGIDGVPVISFRASGLTLTRCANLACTGVPTTTTIDALGSVGEYSSIAIGADGLPIVSYYDSTAGALKVIKCGTRSCL